MVKLDYLSQYFISITACFWILYSPFFCVCVSNELSIVFMIFNRCVYDLKALFDFKHR